MDPTITKSAAPVTPTSARAKQAAKKAAKKTTGKTGQEEGSGGQETGIRVTDVCNVF